MSFKSLFVLLASVAAFSAVAGQVQIPDWDNSVRFEFVTSQEPIRPGDDIEVAVLIDIDEGYHLYGPEEPEPSRTEVVVEGDGLTAGPPSFPPVVRRDLSGLGTYDLYETHIAIRVPLSVDGDRSEDEHAIKATVNFQICTDFACSAPASEVLELTVPGGEAGADVQALYPHVFKPKSN